MTVFDFAGPGLLGQMMEKEPCTVLVRSEPDGPDGQFGAREAWTDGDAIYLAIIKNASPEVTVAERHGEREQYIVVCQRGASLAYGDIIRRDKNGETLRITSRPNDREAPDASTIQIARLTAERYDVN